MYVRFTELPVIDQDRAVEFYTGKLGFRVAQDSPYQDGWRWITREIPGAQTSILLTRKMDDKDTGAPSLVLTVDDVTSSYQELESKGVVFTTEPTQASWNPDELYAVLRDSEGNLVMIGSESK